MKRVISILAICFAVNTIFAEDGPSNSFDNQPQYGISCDLVYKGVLATAAPAVQSFSHKLPGDILVSDKSPKEFEFLDGAHSVKILQNADLSWNIRVRDHKGTEIGSFQFPRKSAMKATFNVDAWDQGEEDPHKYDSLEVACNMVYFAG